MASTNIPSVSFPYRRELSPQQLGVRMDKARRAGKFYHLRDGQYIPLSEEYWRRYPYLNFLVAFNLAGSVDEISAALLELGYDLQQIPGILDQYSITINNYQFDKKQAFDDFKAEMLRNQFAYEQREEKRKDEVEFSHDDRFLGDNKFVINVESKLSGERLKQALQLLLENLLDSPFDLIQKDSHVFVIWFESVIDADIAFNLLEDNDTGFGFELTLEHY